MDAAKNKRKINPGLLIVLLIVMPVMAMNRSRRNRQRSNNSSNSTNRSLQRRLNDNSWRQATCTVNGITTTVSESGPGGFGGKKPEEWKAKLLGPIPGQNLAAKGFAFTKELLAPGNTGRVLEKRPGYVRIWVHHAVHTSFIITQKRKTNSTPSQSARRSRS
jgi:hypothetical protein